MFFTPEPAAARAFIRDKLGLAAHDVGDGWLIFDVAEGEVGCHPTEEGERPHHGISFYCDDVAATRAELASRGVEFTSEIVDRGWGLACTLQIPGGVRVELYEPRYSKGS